VDATTFECFLARTRNNNSDQRPSTIPNTWHYPPRPLFSLMIMRLLLPTVATIVAALVTPVATQNAPVCEICKCAKQERGWSHRIAEPHPSFCRRRRRKPIGGCSYCPAGQFPVGSPAATIPIPPDFKEVAPAGKFRASLMPTMTLLLFSHTFRFNPSHYLLLVRQDSLRYLAVCSTLPGPVV
jgi:hypothetical protein